MKFKVSILLVIVVLLQTDDVFCQNKSSPNVILITVDALRPDHLGCYGYAKNTSPNIDKLAKEGVLFTQAISQAPYTAASFAATFTSTFPRKHRVIGLNERLNKDNLTLAEILREKGFATKAITSNFILSNALGFNQGFEPQEFKDYEGKDETRVAINWLKENKDKRLLLWVHYMEPHAPYDPLPEYNIFVNSNDEFAALPIVENEIGEDGIPKFIVRNNRRDLNYYIGLYDGEIRTADANIGRLLKELERLELMDKSIVILFADHGEELGDHGFYFAHGTVLYDSSVRVPLIIKFKNFVNNPEIIYPQVRLLDISPTILDILGFKIPVGMQGNSLLPLITRRATLPLLAYSYTANRFAVRFKGYKLIYNHHENPGFELYDLNSDPFERINIMNGSLPIAQILKKKLLEEMQRVIPKEMPTPYIVEDEEIIKRMKSLGYIQ